MPHNLFYSRALYKVSKKKGHSVHKYVVAAWLSSRAILVILEVISSARKAELNGATSSLLVAKRKDGSFAEVVVIGHKARAFVLDSASLLESGFERFLPSRSP